MEKISVRALHEFQYNYYNNDKYKNLRFGQAFLNEFYPELSCPELFHEEDTKEAIFYIYDKFVDPGKFNDTMVVEISD